MFCLLEIQSGFREFFSHHTPKLWTQTYVFLTPYYYLLLESAKDINNISPNICVAGGVGLPNTIWMNNQLHSTASLTGIIIKDTGKTFQSLLEPISSSKTKLKLLWGALFHFSSRVEEKYCICTLKCPESAKWWIFGKFTILFKQCVLRVFWMFSNVLLNNFSFHHLFARDLPAWLNDLFL